MLIVTHNPKVRTSSYSDYTTRKVVTPDGVVGFTRSSSCRETTTYVLREIHGAFPGKEYDDVAVDIHGICRCPSAQTSLPNPAHEDRPDCDMSFLPVLYSVELLSKLLIDRVVLGDKQLESFAGSLMGPRSDIGPRLGSLLGLTPGPWFGYSLSSDLIYDGVLRGVLPENYPTTIHSSPDHLPTGSITNIPFRMIRYTPIMSVMTYLVRVWALLHRNDIDLWTRYRGSPRDRVSQQTLVRRLVDDGAPLGGRGYGLFRALANNYMETLSHMYYGGSSFWNFIYLLCAAAEDREFGDRLLEGMTTISNNGFSSWTSSMYTPGSIDRYGVPDTAVTVSKLLNTVGTAAFVMPYTEDV